MFSRRMNKFFVTRISGNKSNFFIGLNFFPVNTAKFLRTDIL